jgi:hypothetical protein
MTIRERAEAVWERIEHNLVPFAVEDYRESEIDIIAEAMAAERKRSIAGVVVPQELFEQMLTYVVGAADDYSYPGQASKIFTKLRELGLYAGKYGSDEEPRI